MHFDPVSQAPGPKCLLMLNVTIYLFCAVYQGNIEGFSSRWYGPIWASLHTPQMYALDVLGFGLLENLLGACSEVRVQCARQRNHSKYNVGYRLNNRTFPHLPRPGDKRLCKQVHISTPQKLTKVFTCVMRIHV